jgi:transcriptional regulator with XRE-family HTH domain
MFYDLYLNLCNKKGVAPTRAAIEIGLSRSTPTTWKNRRLTPQGDTLNKIAAYFGVSVDYLLGNENDGKTPTQGGERELPHAKYREILSEGGIRLMLDADAKVPPEHLDEIIEFIKFKQRKNGR